ncbi:hypothetical protein PIB30_026630 [Stylosanthes scabra]|uniref:Uncharacterized protein n=1 Tax=Stylosanthes scabra TaxID=79078 RepID=A0ABU6XAI6_9FABA|nr:hypothetical protein [Stylosanthes scabra]
MLPPSLGELHHRQPLAMSAAAGLRVFASHSCRRCETPRLPAVPKTKERGHYIVVAASSRRRYENPVFQSQAPSGHSGFHAVFFRRTQLPPIAVFFPAAIPRKNGRQERRQFQEDGSTQQPSPEPAVSHRQASVHRHCRTIIVGGKHAQFSLRGSAVFDAAANPGHCVHHVLYLCNVAAAKTTGDIGSLSSTASKVRSGGAGGGRIAPASSSGSRSVFSILSSARRLGQLLLPLCATTAPVMLRPMTKSHSDIMLWAMALMVWA